MRTLRRARHGVDVGDDATSEDIKAAYRRLAKVCHPDRVGQDGNAMCVLLNEAYDTLADPVRRAQYDRVLDKWLEDDDMGFTGKPLSRWCGPGHKMSKAEEGETRAVFVDENSCIGCKQCVWVAAATFRMENEYGRSRAFAQWLNSEDEIQCAIDCCPVSCIHWVEKQQLPALEFAMQNLVDRVDVGIMMAGQGGGVADPFEAARQFEKRFEDRRRRREEDRSWAPEQAAARMDAAVRVQKAKWGKIGEALYDGLWLGLAGVSGGAGEAASDRVRRRAELRSKRRQTAAKAGDALATTVLDSIDELEREHARGRGGGSVPLERALVPVSAYAATATRRE
ncbi:unnamed protein product [Pedinophyceae sp. YPF-701]|nr:unnamed protein product [Pedinophyceae sp. YPF-701]